MKFYIVRHGQTDWNLEGRIQGRTDIELNENGIKQAKEVKEIIRNYDISLIVSSPLKRAKKTAEIINESLNCNIMFDEALIERGYGEFEGKILREINDEVISSDLLDNYYINKDYKGIETIQSLYNRVCNLLDNLKQDYNNQNILIVTHGGTLRAINGYFNGMNKDGYMEKPNFKNCEIKTYII